MLSLPYSEAVKTNYYALVISILCTCIPETAFEKLQSEKPGSVRNQISDADYADMVKLRAEGLFYRELGEIYCMDPSIIHRYLKRFSKRGA